MSLKFPNDVANLVVSLTLVRLLGFMKERFVTFRSETSLMTLHSYTSQTAELVLFERVTHTTVHDRTNNGGNSN